MSFFRRLLGKKDPPQRDEDLFAQRIIDGLQAVSSEIRVEYDPQAFELLHVDGGAAGQRMFLYNSFVEYQRLAGEEQDQHLARVIAFILDSRNPRPKGEAALDMLLPILRARADMLAVSAERQGQFPYTNTSRPFCDTMLLMLAIDSDVSIAMVTDDSLAELGVPFEVALGIAIGHLNERGGHSFGQLAEGTFVSTCGDYYDASRILLPDLFLQLPLKGNPVAIVQARSAILVTGSEDVDGLAMIAGFALDDLAENERAVSLSPIELVNGQWRPFEIRAHHPQRLRNLVPNQLVWAYGATQQVVQELLGEDVFVASALLVEREGMAATAATWATGVTTACPLVEAVVIGKDGEFPEIIRSLNDVLKICGPFPEVAAFPHPPRWILPETISAEQHAELTNNCRDHIFFEE